MAKGPRNIKRKVLEYFTIFELDDLVTSRTAAVVVLGYILTRKMFSR